ncbi:Omp28-related outer membrane protein [Salinimicrobium xinjiangense]|uniref:Omp28-related outer membrane protein n=1 Tax=Salinimicrobium xinjiangense TaxID=438596 RepID=UPI00041C0B1A|nr:Omp28-related outer membrane protein [Salinimicrobium xinjiangense]
MKYSQSFNSLAGLIITVIFLFSCSSDDASGEGGNTSGPGSIQLSTNNSTGTAAVNETVYFKVEGNDGKDYTSQSTIYLAGEALERKSFQFSGSGTHEFTAKMNKLTSNKISINVKKPQIASQPDAITLTSNLESSKTDINKNVIFRVLGDNGFEYTSLSTIQINGETISGNQYTFNQGGEHDVIASFNELNSNTLSIQVSSSNYLTVSRDKALKGQEVNFQFFGSNGEDATADATFYVNGSAVNGNSFQSDTEGSFEVTAKAASGEETEPKTFEVFTPKRKALFEDYTGTWCGWCPRVTNAILLLKERTEDLAVVAIHFQDKMMIDESKDLVAHFEVEFYPHARLNRVSQIPFPEDEEEQLLLVLNTAGEESPYSIAINTELNNDKLDIEVKLVSEVQIPQGYKLVVYLLQNGVIFPQENYLNNDPQSRWYQKGEPIKDFIHDDVLQASLTNVFGDELNAISALEEVSFKFGTVDLSQFSYSAPGNFYNPNNFEVVAIITRPDNTALNAQKVTAGHNVNFE